MKIKKGINLYYVGAGHVADAILQGNNDSWTHPTLDKAIKHATNIIECDKDKEIVIVVKIVTIVRRKKIPVSIEILK